MRAEGAKDEAAAVKKLRRPTVAAAAVNRLVRNAPDRIEALIAIGDRLRSAHEDLLEGRGDAGIRTATAERRRLVAALTAQAVEDLGAGGASQQEAIGHTLEAAVADVGAAAEVRAGRLATDLAPPSGFGGGLVSAEPAPARRGSTVDERRRARPAPAPDDAGEERDRTEREQAKQQRAEHERAKQERAARERADEQVREERRAQRAAEHAAAAARAAAQEVTRLRAEVENLRDEITQAEARLRAAEADAQDAQRVSAAAQQELGRLHDSP